MWVIQEAANVAFTNATQDNRDASPFLEPSAVGS